MKNKQIQIAKPKVIANLGIEVIDDKVYFPSGEDFVFETVARCDFDGNDFKVLE